MSMAWCPVCGKLTMWRGRRGARLADVRCWACGREGLRAWRSALGPGGGSVVRPPIVCSACGFEMHAADPGLRDVPPVCLRCRRSSAAAGTRQA